jgi:hypothetical protein
MCASSLDMHPSRNSEKLDPLPPLLLLLLLPPLLLLLLLLLPPPLLLLLCCRYARGTVQPANSPNITINSGNYRNINPLDLPTADKIWGQYSQRCALLQASLHEVEHRLRQAKALLLMRRT